MQYILNNSNLCKIKAFTISGNVKGARSLKASALKIQNYWAWRGNRVGQTHASQMT